MLSIAHLSDIRQVIDIQNVINALTSSSYASMQTETNSESLSTNNMIGGYNDNNDTESIIDLSSILASS